MTIDPKRWKGASSLMDRKLFHPISDAFHPEHTAAYLEGDFPTMMS